MPKAMMRTGRSRTARRRRIALTGAGEGRLGSWQDDPYLSADNHRRRFFLPFSVIHASFFDYFPNDRLS